MSQPRNSGFLDYKKALEERDSMQIGVPKTSTKNPERFVAIPINIKQTSPTTGYLTRYDVAHTDWQRLETHGLFTVTNVMPPGFLMAVAWNPKETILDMAAPQATGVLIVPGGKSINVGSAEVIYVLALSPLGDDDASAVMEPALVYALLSFSAIVNAGQYRPRQYGVFYAGEEGPIRAIIQGRGEIDRVYGHEIDDAAHAHTLYTHPYQAPALAAASGVTPDWMTVATNFNDYQFIADLDPGESLYVTTDVSNGYLLLMLALGSA